MARGQSQRRCRRQDQRPFTKRHQRDVEVLLLEPVPVLPVVEPDVLGVVELLEPDVLGVVELVEPDVLGVVELVEPPVPVAPIEDVLPVLPLAVVSLLVPVLPVVVLGVLLALPLRLPVPLEPGVVLELELLVAPVPLVPPALSARWHAP